MGEATFWRYDKAWNLLVPAVLRAKLVSNPTRFMEWEGIPLYKLALVVAAQARERSLFEGRNMYAALMLFPCFQALCFEKALARVKRAWNAAHPKYHWFYDVSSLLTVIARDVVSTEEDARLRCILLLHFLALFRGCDLAAASRLLRCTAQPWFLHTTRKGRQFPAWYHVHTITPGTLCPQRAIQRYVEFTSDYIGDALFISLTLPRRPLYANRINSLTSQFLKQQGIQVFTAQLRLP